MHHRHKGCVHAPCARCQVVCPHDIFSDRNPESTPGFPPSQRPWARPAEDVPAKVDNLDELRKLLTENPGTDAVDNTPKFVLRYVFEYSATRSGGNLTLSDLRGSMADTMARVQVQVKRDVLDLEAAVASHVKGVLALCPAPPRLATHRLRNFLPISSAPNPIPQQP